MTLDIFALLAKDEVDHFKVNIYDHIDTCDIITNQ